jgi:hypothetical protein
MRKIFEADGREQVEYLTCTMTLNFLTRMQRVPEKLCGGGPCFYVPDSGLDTTIMITFVLSRVVPNIRMRLPESACLVLGKALLLLICSPVADEYIPSDFKRDVLLEWEHVRGADFDAKLNPIKKMAVTVSRGGWGIGANALVY